MAKTSKGMGNVLMSIGNAFTAYANYQAEGTKAADVEASVLPKQYKETTEGFRTTTGYINKRYGGPR